MAILPTTPLETALLAEFPDYALESLRTRFLYFVTSDHAPADSVRAVVQMAYETELGVPLSRTIAIVPGIAAETVSTRRRSLSIDEDMQSFMFLYEPALKALDTLEILPRSYVRFLESYIRAPYSRYRMCALATLLCFSAVHFGDLG
jgi:hypothetical protein